MRVPSTALNCVCFLVGDSESKPFDGGRALLGTGFFVSFAENGVEQAYLVTAKHVVSHPDYPSDLRVYARFVPLGQTGRHSFHRSTLTCVSATRGRNCTICRF